MVPSFLFKIAEGSFGLNFEEDRDELVKLINLNKVINLEQDQLAEESSANPMISENIMRVIQEDGPLLDYLEDPHSLQAFRMEIPSLIQYLCTLQRITELVDIMFTEHRDDHNLPRFSRSSLVATEILSSNQVEIKLLLLNPSVLERFLVLLERPPPLSPFVLSSFCRVFHNLLTQYGSQLVTTIDERHIVHLALKHAHSFPICEFIYAVVLLIDSSKGRSFLFNWLQTHSFISTILTIIHTTFDPVIPSNLEQLLYNVTSRFLDPIAQISIDDLFTQRDMTLLLEIGTNPWNNRAFVYIIQFLIDIIWNSRPSFEDSDSASTIDEYFEPCRMIQWVVLDHLQLFVDVLKENPPAFDSKGYISRPFCFQLGDNVGSYRLRVIILFSTLLRSIVSERVDNAVLSTDLLSTLVEMFFQFPNNSILHSELFTLLEHILAVRGGELRAALILETRFVENITCEVWKEYTRRTGGDVTRDRPASCVDRDCLTIGQSFVTSTALDAEQRTERDNNVHSDEDTRNETEIGKDSSPDKIISSTDSKHGLLSSEMSAESIKEEKESSDGKITTDIEPLEPTVPQTEKREETPNESGSEETIPTAVEESAVEATAARSHLEQTPSNHPQPESIPSHDASSSQLVSGVMEGDEKEEEAGYPSTDNQQNEASLGSPEDTLLTKPANEHENGEADGVGSERVVGDATPLGFHSERLITVSRAFYSIRTFSHPSVSAGSQQGRSVGSSSPSFVVHLAHILIQSQSEFSRIREAFARMGEWGKMQGMVVDEEIAKQESEGLPVVKRVNLYAEMLKDPSFGESSEEERQELMLEKKKEYDELLRKMREKREKEQEEQEGEEEDEMQLSESESSDWESESESESWESSSEEGFEEVVVFREISEMQQREEGRLNEKKRLELERMMGGQKEGEDGQFVICGQRVQFSGEGKESGAEEQSEEDEDGDLSSSSSSGKESEGQSESEKEEWSSDSHSKSDSSHHSDDDADEVSEGSTESTERMHSDSEDDDTSASFEKDELEPV
ncbi:hypothetical protein BLNAU_15630 [Blattamonas nauphoetae]|uniref:Uncharacterized protein n=1 Tax=Blattamonas nauphoetae TaxID=2049346 RepID=A0ABQ9XF03_9EUKA|nr:hypothetical protein BLNAU_15630 [Blattamonas nauphoetae]